MSMPMQNAGMDCGASAGEEASIEHLHNGTISQANDVLSNQACTSSQPNSFSIPGTPGIADATASDGTPRYGTPGRSQPVESLALVPAPISHPCYMYDQSHNTSSQLQQQYYSDYQNNARASMLCNQEDQYGRFVRFVRDNPLHTIEGRGENFISDFENRVFYHGYYPESYERTRLPWPGKEAHLGQTESSCWQASQSRPYQTPLSGSTPATPTADPLSLAHTIHQASAFPDTPHPAPLYNTSSLSTPSYTIYNPQSYTRATPHEPKSSKLDWRSQSQSQIQSTYFDTTKTPAKRQMPASMGEFVHGDQSCSQVPLSIQTSIKIHDSGPKKRSRAVNQISTNITAAALAANPEGFKVSAKSAFTPRDHENIQTLVTAMNDMSATEDNEGMIRSWNKLKVQKAAKVIHVCEDLLVTIKRAIALQGKPLSDHKRSSNAYPTFDIRFRAVYETLKTQKTVCKHLLEDPYLYQVVDDPVYASMRVTNNRRVNKGKKDAIEQGRKLMGLKGNGKGHPLVKQDSLEFDNEHDDSEEEQAIKECSDLQDIGIRSHLKRPLFPEQPSICESIEEDDFAQPTKKARRTNRSTPRIDNSEPAEIPFTTSEDVSEGLGFIKAEENSLSPYDNPIAEADLHGPLGHPLNHYFGSQIDFHPVDMTYEACPAVQYQNLDSPTYTGYHHSTPQQITQPQSFDAANPGHLRGFDGHEEPEPYDDWVYQNFQM